MPGGCTEYGSPLLPGNGAGKTHWDWEKGGIVHCSAGLTARPKWELLCAKTWPVLQPARVQLSNVVAPSGTCLRSWEVPHHHSTETLPAFHNLNPQNKGISIQVHFHLVHYTWLLQFVLFLY